MEQDDSSKVAKKRVEDEGGKEVECETGKAVEYPKQKPLVQDFQPRILYPTRLMEDHANEQYKRFVDLFKQLLIILLFVDALSQIPKPAKISQRSLH